MRNKIRWESEDQKIYIDEFLDLYNNRPIQDNTGGMKSSHMFNAWYVIKKLQPKYIIESGVWKGQGTWFFEKASPDSTIICIDPAPHNRQITSSKAQYLQNDFLTIDWQKSIDTSQALVFFDDHQSCVERIKYCISQKFIHLMFEDNYPWDQGDCYSPKKILSRKNYVIDQAGNKTYYAASNTDFDTLIENIDIYQEMPPLFKDNITRWGNNWDLYDTPESLINESDKNKYQIFYNERFDYTWICYFKLKI
jgi:hypothetical protein